MNPKQFISPNASKEDKKITTCDAICFVAGGILAFLLFLFVPNRYSCGPLFFKSNIIEQISFDNERWNAPRGDIHIDVAYIKMENDTVKYVSYEPDKIRKFGIENIIGKKVRYAVRERDTNHIFGLAVNRKLVFSDVDNGYIVIWWILVVVDLLLFAKGIKCLMW